MARFVLHNHLSKEEQLLVFINHVWFDEGIRGFRNAANHFYQKNVDELTEDEFISLVAMPVNPKGFNIFLNSENNKIRSKLISAMLQGKYQPKGLFDI
ncbi:MAG: transglycosylase domain-containing protein [Candidatus Thiodiazotropha sp. (ex Lucinoma kastoroae)]|nr:transglycosylase domain-containing protein [Candidatus Thiodiazotropha sp. (ex Lucinoma kastoroae)]